MRTWPRAVATSAAGAPATAARAKPSSLIWAQMRLAWARSHGSRRRSRPCRHRGRDGGRAALLERGGARRPASSSMSPTAWLTSAVVVKPGIALTLRPGPMTSHGRRGEPFTPRVIAS